MSKNKSRERLSQVTLPARRYASLAEGATYASCNVATLRVLIAKGKLTRYRVGRVVRIDLNELDAVLQADGAE